MNEQLLNAQATLCMRLNYKLYIAEMIKNRGTTPDADNVLELVLNLLDKDIYHSAKFFVDTFDNLHDLID